MRGRFASLLGILIGIAIFISPAYAMKHKGEMCHTGHKFFLPLSEWWKCPEISSKIQITDKEKEELAKLLTETKEKILALKKKIKENREILRKMLFSEKAKEDELMKQFKEIQKIRMELMKTRFQYILGVRKILGVKRFEMLMKTLKMRRQWKKRGEIRKHYQKHHRHHGHHMWW